MVMPNTAGRPAAKNEFRQLRLDGVSRSFGGAHALEKLSLTIERGEFIALLGPSGCGKSTALNCMAGLMPLSDGSIWLDERRMDTLPPEKRGFGMVFQNYALFPHLSVSRNVGFGLKMRGVPAAEIDQRVAAALDTVQLHGARPQAARPAVGRPAAARGDRARHRDRAAADPDGRAAVQPGRQAAH